MMNNETHFEYRDSFEGACPAGKIRISVELVLGTWTTFLRTPTDHDTRPRVKAHASREAARDWARNYLA